MKYLVLIACSIFVLSACLKEDDQLLDYSKARACLDKAGKDGAKACVAPLAYNSSARASKLRCAAEFIAQGLDTNALANIFSDIQSSDSEDLNATMSALCFEGADAAEAEALAKSAYDNCNASGSTGMAMFGSLSYSATKMASLSGTIGKCPENYLDGIGAASTDDDIDLGNTVLNIQNVYCSQASSNSDVCSQIADIIGSNTSPEDIGAAFRSYIDN